MIQMIKFEGIRPTTGDMSIIRFSNEKGAIVEIPVENSVAGTISMYLARISTASVKPVERGNDESSD